MTIQRAKSIGITYSSTWIFTEASRTSYFTPHWHCWKMLGWLLPMQCARALINLVWSSLPLIVYYMWVFILKISFDSFCQKPIPPYLGTWPVCRFWKFCAWPVSQQGLNIAQWNQENAHVREKVKKSEELKYPTDINFKWYMNTKNLRIYRNRQYCMICQCCFLKYCRSSKEHRKSLTNTATTKWRSRCPWHPMNRCSPMSFRALRRDLWATARVCTSIVGGRL